MTAPGDRVPARPSRESRAADWRAHLPTVSLVVLGLVLYARGLTLGYVGDDYKLLDAALRYPLGELLSGRHGILGYYRPVSRELYFWWWGRVLGLGPFGFHVVNALTFAGVVVLVERLGRAWAGPRAGRLAAAAFVLFPPGSALLSWVSCAQDLVMLFWAALAMLLHARGRRGWAGVATGLAALSKETAVVLPAALAVMDWRLERGVPARARLARLAPSLAGLAAAGAIAIAARSRWPAGTAVTVWSPGQFAQAGWLPLHFARALLPPDTVAGIVQALSAQPVWLAIVAAAAACAVPGAMRPSASARGRSNAASGPRAGSLVAFGIALALLAMLPVGFVSERWRGYFFSLSAVGASLAGGVWLAGLPAGVSRAALALGAIVNFGAGGIYRPLETATGPARHPHVNYAFFRDTGALSTQLIRALEPWCGAIRSLPRTFAAGIPPDEVFASALGPGLRVTCRDTVARVRFLAEFTPADAATEFGVLRFDPRSGRFLHERADRRVRARVGEGFLIHARFDVAAACYQAAARDSLERRLSYPLAVSLAAAGRGDEARARWGEAARRGALPEVVLPAGPAAVDSGAREIAMLSAAVLRAPWEAEPHRALGRALLARDHPREASFELAAAVGIGRQNPDLAWLGRGYQAMGLTDEALAAYQRALAAGLPDPLYRETRDRMIALMREQRAALDRSGTHP